MELATQPHFCTVTLSEFFTPKHAVLSTLQLQQEAATAREYTLNAQNLTAVCHHIIESTLNLSQIKVSQSNVRLRLKTKVPSSSAGY
jgi:hypothetical protein